jgi:hypothetical protein
VKLTTFAGRIHQEKNDRMGTFLLRVSNEGVHGTIFGEDIDFFFDHNSYRSSFLIRFGWH